ncbi:G-type lectin S-receptor-like serine/threonine-protein kinase LECRK4 [Salvia miltiorrhiza]|uniref:G-type lectin S-receptor-like serine/threonine-protein kinase LECRK4 n=1 Tax=Salvia miltiorrhiza TaxID=226208 RepID=UPI0025ABC969|nr:G-type lectin S-receptor-like serine/threonine-protein kinase LECRK4 [Salvia miltiorrhiza]
MAAFPSSIILLSTALLLLFPHFTCAQNINVGTSLTATSNSNPWRSSNGDFAFGFQQLQGNYNQYVLSIWFDKIPQKTIVWYERSSYPVPRGSTLRLDAATGLILEDPQGRHLYNTTGGGPADEVGYASMNDTGNFVIRRRSDSSILWESFRNPTDTILPTQTIEIGDTLVSRKTEENFSMGRFYAAINNAGDLVFNTKSVPSNSEFDDEYYSSFTSSQQNASEAGFRVVFKSEALISILKRNGKEQILSPPSLPLPSENYYRATLDFNGVFTQYYRPKNLGNNVNPSWSVARSWPDNICMFINGDTGSGACGYNSVCRIENRRPVCECPQGFSLADPTDPNSDCKPNFVQGCFHGSLPQEEYELEIIKDTDWPKNDYQLIKPSSEEQCRSACLNDCLCDVSIYRDNSCWKKKLPLSNGRVNTAQGLIAFLKLRKRDVPLLNPQRPRRDRQTLIVVISVLFGSSAFINFLFITAACLLIFLVHNKKLPALNPSGSNLRCFTYKELELATDGFKDELGRGAFGIVYKGAMPMGSDTMVAVKKLDRMFQDSEKEFKTEVNVIGRTHHKNLVSLIGFCDEGSHRLLVYEYMSNGTLAGFLFGHLRPSWSLRTQMGLGIAKGLTYLHEECSTQIIHCDIKPQNILLDEYYIARISDFGLAKLLTMNQSKTLTGIRGTKGYVAPEWFRNTQISVKVDVYSFGVVLLEIISCRKIIEDGLEFGDGENPILTDWAWDCFVERRLDVFVKNDEEALRDGKMLERFVKVGLWCVQEDVALRPTMKKVCQMLEGVVEVPEPSNPSSFTSLV